MKKAEAQKILGFVDEHMTTHPKDMDRFLDLFLDFIDSMTTDTDPRLEVVERIRKAIPSMTGLFGDHWCNQEAVRIESLEDELDKIESEIKQEAGDE
jgi:hypothetical protein